jgi:chemotaxis regulatin CheY-phosphate phosphatase CheZ
VSYGMYFARWMELRKKKLMVAMYAGNQTDLCDALLRGNAICSGVTDSQLERLTFARIATDNGAVIKSVSNLVKAINRNLQQIIAVRTWYANLVFGSNDDPRDVASSLRAGESVRVH